MGTGAERGDERWVTRMIRTAPGAVQLALRMLQGETVQLRAMALTYISLFALVPGLVVAFSVVQAFTGMERISNRLHEFLFENLAVGARATIEPYLDRFVQNAHVTSAGLVGAALLIWSSVSLFQNVDRAVNDIWGVRRRRSIVQQATIYWVGMTLGPLLLAGSVMAGHATRTLLASARLGFLGTAASALLTCTFFAIVYVIVPNTRVKVRNAVAGALVAGLAWELAKWGYASFVARSVRYHAIYGSVAAIPIFLLWVYLSWSILLFGARLAFVFQYASSLVQSAHTDSRTGREILGGRALLVIARAFVAGALPLDAGEVASQLGAAVDDVSEALAALKASAIVVSTADGGLVPGRPLEAITLFDVRRALGGNEPLSASDGLIAAVVKRVNDEAAQRLADVTFRALCDQDRGGKDGERSAAPSLAEREPAEQAVPSA